MKCNMEIENGGVVVEDDYEFLQSHYQSIVRMLDLNVINQTPSEITEGEIHWVWALMSEKEFIKHEMDRWETRSIEEHMKERSRVGKWLVFVQPDDVDKIWEKIKKATEDGLLGGTSKVSTAARSKSYSGSKQHVICIYTDDWTDENDVMRVREELRKLGITKKIPYKSDEDTLSGKYAKNGYKNISKYFA